MLGVHDNNVPEKIKKTVRLFKLINAPVKECLAVDKTPLNLEIPPAGRLNPDEKPGPDSKSNHPILLFEVYFTARQKAGQSFLGMIIWGC